MQVLPRRLDLELFLEFPISCFTRFLDLHVHVQLQPVLGLPRNDFCSSGEMGASSIAELVLYGRGG